MISCEIVLICFTCPAMPVGTVDVILRALVEFLIGNIDPSPVEIIRQVPKCPSRRHLHAFFGLTRSRDVSQWLIKSDWCGVAKKRRFERNAPAGTHVGDLDSVGGVLARPFSGADLRQPRIPRRARGPI